MNNVKMRVFFLTFIIACSNISCKESSKSKTKPVEELERYSSSYEDIKKNHKENLLNQEITDSSKMIKRDTFYLKKNQIVFFKPNEKDYNNLVEKYGQPVIEVDSDTGFVFMGLINHLGKNSQVSIKLIDKNNIIMNFNKEQLILSTEETKSYGAIIVGEDVESIKIINGILPKEFYLEEISKLKKK